MLKINGLLATEAWIVRSVLHNCWGYPMKKDNSLLLGFDAGLCDKLRDKLFTNEIGGYSPSPSDKYIILKSFQVFLSEIDDYETVPLTDHTKPEVQTLYEKLKGLYHDAAQSVG